MERHGDNMDFVKNQHLMKAIKAVHSMVNSDNIDKHRQSQDNIGILLGSNKEITYEGLEIDGISAEWVFVNRKHEKKHIILYCHGGGYFTGSVKYARTLTTKLALTTSLEVLSFDYALAPEEPYPASLRDALKVWDYLMYQGYGSKDIIVAGDSAGGNLALVLIHKLKQQGRKLPLGVILMSPWTDLTLSGKSHTTKADIDPVLDAPYLEFAVKSYIQQEENLEDPLISPLFGDFEQFPPVYIQVGDNEVLLSDSVNLQKKIVKSSSYAKIDIYKGMWHVFQMSPFKTGNDAVDKIADFILQLI